MSGAECHARVDDNVVFSLGHIGVKRAVHGHKAGHDDRLEVVFLPLAVPVATFDKLGGIADFDGYRLGCHSIGHSLGTIARGRDVGYHRRAVVVGFETLESGFGESVGEQVAGVTVAWRKSEGHFVIVVHRICMQI